MLLSTCASVCERVHNNSGSNSEIEMDQGEAGIENDVNECNDTNDTIPDNGPNQEIIPSSKHKTKGISSTAYSEKNISLLNRIATFMIMTILS